MITSATLTKISSLFVDRYDLYSMICFVIILFCMFLFFFVYPLIYYTLIIPKIKKKLGVIKSNWITASQVFFIKPFCLYGEVASVIAIRYLVYKFTGNPNYKRKIVSEKDGFWFQDYPVNLYSKLDVFMSFVVSITLLCGLIFGVSGFIFMKLSHAG